MPRAKPKERILSIQVCRGLAALLVVLAHLHNMEHKYFTTNYMGIFQYGTLGVDLFFVISGVVISAVTVGKFGNPGNARTFLYHRFARIYPIYWIYSAAVLIAYIYNPLLVNASGDHHVHVIQSFLLIPTALPMLLLQGWTLTYEIYFYFVFFILLFFSPAKLVLKLLILWAAAVLAISIFHPHGGPVISVLISPAILEFLAGCFLFRLYRKAYLHPRAGFFLVLSALVWLIGVGWWTAHAHGSDSLWIENSAATRVAAYGTFAVLFLLGAMEMERSKFISFALPLVAIGDWSYSIYLSHTIILKLVSHPVSVYAAQRNFAIWIVGIVSVPAVLLTGYLSFTYLERPIIAVLYKPSTKPALPYQAA